VAVSLSMLAMNNEPVMFVANYTRAPSKRKSEVLNTSLSKDLFCNNLQTIPSTSGISSFKKKRRLEPTPGKNSSPKQFEHVSLQVSDVRRIAVPSGSAEQTAGANPQVPETIRRSVIPPASVSGSESQTVVSFQTPVTEQIQNVINETRNASMLPQENRVQVSDVLKKHDMAVMQGRGSCQPERFGHQWSDIPTGYTRPTLLRYNENVVTSMSHSHLLRGVPRRDLALPRLWTTYNSPLGNIVRVSNNAVSQFGAKSPSGVDLSPGFDGSNPAYRRAGVQAGRMDALGLSSQAPVVPGSNPFGNRTMNGVSALSTQSQQYPRMRQRNRWGEDEDMRLRDAVKRYGSNWKMVARMVVTRDAPKCAQRWRKSLRPELARVRKGKWCTEEDSKLVALVARWGPNDLWNRISKAFCYTRSPKQCRERWQNFLDPSLNNGSWTQAEDGLLLKLHAIHGSSWAQIASSFSGRTNDRVKRRVQALLRKRKREKIIGMSHPLLNISKNAKLPTTK